MPLNTLQKLSRIVAQRAKKIPRDSYTVRLLKSGENEILAKIYNEYQEMVKAFQKKQIQKGKNSVTWEIADLLYHLTVLMEKTKKATWEDVFKELERRMKKS